MCKPLPATSPPPAVLLPDGNQVHHRANNPLQNRFPRPGKPVSGFTPGNSRSNRLPVPAKLQPAVGTAVLPVLLLLPAGLFPVVFQLPDFADSLVGFLQSPTCRRQTTLASVPPAVKGWCQLPISVHLAEKFPPVLLRVPEVVSAPVLLLQKHCTWR